MLRDKGARSIKSPNFEGVQTGLILQIIPNPSDLRSQPSEMLGRPDATRFLFMSPHFAYPLINIEVFAD